MLQKNYMSMNKNIFFQVLKQVNTLNNDVWLDTSSLSDIWNLTYLTKNGWSMFYNEAENQKFKNIASLNLKNQLKSTLQSHVEWRWLLHPIYNGIDLWIFKKKITITYTDNSNKTHKIDNLIFESSYFKNIFNQPILFALSLKTFMQRYVYANNYATVADVLINRKNRKIEAWTDFTNNMMALKEDIAINQSANTLKFGDGNNFSIPESFNAENYAIQDINMDNNEVDNTIQSKENAENESLYYTKQRVIFLDLIFPLDLKYNEKAHLDNTNYVELNQILKPNQIFSVAFDMSHFSFLSSHSSILKAIMTQDNMFLNAEALNIKNQLIYTNYENAKAYNQCDYFVNDIYSIYAINTIEELNRLINWLDIKIEDNTLMDKTIKKNEIKIVNNIDFSHLIHEQFQTSKKALNELNNNKVTLANLTNNAISQSFLQAIHVNKEKDKTKNTLNLSAIIDANIKKQQAKLKINVTKEEKLHILNTANIYDKNKEED